MICNSTHSFCSHNEVNEGCALSREMLVCSVAAFSVFPLFHRALLEPLEDDDTAESAGGGLRGLVEPTALRILVHPHNVSSGSFKATFN